MCSAPSVLEPGKPMLPLVHLSKVTNAGDANISERVPKKMFSILHMAGRPLRGSLLIGKRQLWLQLQGQQEEPRLELQVKQKLKRRQEEL